MLQSVTTKRTIKHPAQPASEQGFRSEPQTLLEVTTVSHKYPSLAIHVRMPRPRRCRWLSACKSLTTKITRRSLLPWIHGSSSDPGWAISEPWDHWLVGNAGISNSTHARAQEYWAVHWNDTCPRTYILCLSVSIASEVKITKTYLLASSLF